MDIKSHKVGGTAIDFVSRGSTPELLLVSGVHGDEWESISLVEKAVEREGDLLPDFIFIPVMSPSAVETRTRLNKWGEDLNRGFTEGEGSEEVEAAREILGDHFFDLAVFFHEDSEKMGVYVYDWVKEGDEAVTEMILKYLAELKGEGIELFSGVDDQDDVTLGYKFENGYGRVNHTDLSYQEDFEFFDAWMLKNGKCDRALTIEVPGLVSMEQKRLIIDVFFRNLVRMTKTLKLDKKLQNEAAIQ